MEKRKPPLTIVGLVNRCNDNENRMDIPQKIRTDLPQKLPIPFLGVFPKNIKTRLIIFFAADDGEAPYSQPKQDKELTVVQIMKSLLPNSDLN